jgi:hypothetical protein
MLRGKFVDHFTCTRIAVIRKSKKGVILSRDYTFFKLLTLDVYHQSLMVNAIGRLPL